MTKRFCPTCAGRQNCQQCLGIGVLRCPNCNARGCDDCGGNGSAQCPTCDGRGVCPDCKGLGVIEDGRAFNESAREES